MSPAFLETTNYTLCDLVGGKVINHDKMIGKLYDIVISESGKMPIVTHLIVSRSFGYKSIMVPWDKVVKLDVNGTTKISIDKLETYENDPVEGQVCLKDHLLDKKVLDCDDHEVEVVYDIKLAARNGNLYVTDVDCSRAGFLRRIGLRRLSNLIRELAAKIKDDTIPWTYVQPLPSDIGPFKGNVKLNVLKSKLSEINPVDLADILEELEHEQRMEIFNQLDTEKASDTLEEIEPRVQREMVASLSVDRAAELINDMSPAQAVDMLVALPATVIDTILEKIDAGEREKIRLLLEKHDDHIIGFASTHYIASSPDVPVKEIIQSFKKMAEDADADVVDYIYITSPTGVLIGLVDLKSLLLADPQTDLGSNMVADVITLSETDTVATATKIFNRYGFRALPIVSEKEILIGVIPYRDIASASKLV